MSEYTQILVDKPRSNVTRVTLNRPQKQNATNMTMMAELLKAFKDIKRDSETRAVILRGAGRAFCAGHDINEAIEREPYALSFDRWFIEQKAVLDDIDTCRRMMTEIPQPVIAQVQGHCYTVGIELAMSCDLVYVADDLKLAVRMAGGGGRYIHMIPWLAGIRRAKEIVFTGAVISGDEAYRIGLANGVVRLDKLDEHVLGVAEQIAKVPLEFLALDKQAMNKCLDLMGARDGMEYSATLHAVSHMSKAGLAQEEALYHSDDWKKSVEARDARYSKARD